MCIKVDMEDGNEDDDNDNYTTNTITIVRIKIYKMKKARVIDVYKTKFIVKTS